MEENKVRKNVVKVRMNEDELNDLDRVSNNLGLNKSEVLRMGLMFMMTVASEHKWLISYKIK